MVGVSEGRLVCVGVLGVSEGRLVGGRFRG